MAVMIISQPELRTGAFGKNMMKVNTNNPNLIQVKYELERQSQKLGEQFVPVFGVFVDGTLTFLQSNIELSGLYKSTLPSYNNFLNFTGTFQQSSTSEHEKTINDLVYENETLQITQERKIFKAVDINLPAWDSGEKTFNPLFKNKNGQIIRKVFNGQKIPISFYTNANATTFSLFLLTTTGHVGIGNSAFNSHYRLCGYKLNTNHKRVSIVIPNADPTILNVDHNNYKSKKVIYFLNRWGGWDWFPAIHSEITEKTRKNQYSKYEAIDQEVDVMQLVGDTIIEERLYGELMNSEYYEYLKDIVRSPIILDEMGRRVRLLDTNIKYGFRDLTDPQFTIQYATEKNINY